MVRTYWLVPVFNEASGNLDLQPDRTDDQIEAKSPPCYVPSMVARAAAPSGGGFAVGRRLQPGGLVRSFAHQVEAGAADLPVAHLEQCRGPMLDLDLVALGARRTRTSSSTSSPASTKSSGVIT